MTTLATSYGLSDAIVRDIYAPSPNVPGASPDAASEFARAMEEVRDTLLSWRVDPSALEDDETDAPTRETIDRALGLTDRIIITDDWWVRGVGIDTGGSISLEFHKGTSQFLTISLEPGGTAEILYFSNGSLIRREPIDA